MSTPSRRSVAVFGVTSMAAFWINAAGHLWLLRRRHPLVCEHKGTLQFRSALLGDAVLLPLVNVLLDRQLREWNDGTPVMAARRARSRRTLLAALGLTAFLHGVQATKNLTNWTMPRPWRWTAMGYYHAIYMAGQIGLLISFCATAGQHTRRRGVNALLTRNLLAALVSLVAFAGLVYKDYY